MAIPVILPRQGQSVESCIIGQWYKSIGEKVSEGDLLFSYETDKSSFEEEARAEGVLLAIFFEEGDEAPVLSTVAVIGKEGESIEEYSTASGEDQKEVIPSAAKDEKEEESPKVIEFDVDDEDAVKHLRISPLAKNMAAKMGVDVSQLKGTGPRGRIIARDVEGAVKTQPVTTDRQPAEKPEHAAKPAANVPLQKGADFEDKSIPHIRKLIASAMHQSLQNSAQLTHHLSADARRLLKLRKKFKQALSDGSVSQNVTINDLVCFAVIRALENYPQANTHYLGDKTRWFNKVNLGLAVDTERGLMVPALQNADDLSITGLSYQLQNLAGQARNGNINPDLLRPEAASFTVSNLGNYGVEMFTPIINLPQTAILGVCTITPRPMEIEEGVYGFVPTIGLSLTYDHRALDGGEATRFLAEIKTQIEKLEV